MPVTIESRLVLSGYRPSGFDYMRIVLASLIILWHTIMVCYGVDAQRFFYTDWPRAAVYVLVPAFFTLSGFLVANSLARNTLEDFILFRALRIFPALVVEVVISAIVIGPLLTSLPLTGYLKDALFVNYFGNALGHIQYYLPGLFHSNPTSIVNAQLWTIPIELECYLLAVGLRAFGLVQRAGALLAITVASSIGLFAISTLKGWAYTGHPPGLLVVLCFLSGVVLHTARSIVPHSRVLLVASVAAAVACFSGNNYLYLGAMPLSYAVVYLGCLNPVQTALSRMADYSYGMFLYGFVIQQVVYTLLPFGREWHANFAISWLVALLLGAASWHLLEKPIAISRSRIAHAVRCCSSMSLGPRSGNG